MLEKERLDIILVNREFFKSRERARGAIMSGHVYVNGIKEEKCGSKFAVDCDIEVREKQNPYVSRGGLKLHKGIETFKIDLKDKICIDIGSSTGGFTDCMLKNGAKKVFAVDVGYGQLAWELRNDARVICMERTNIRYVEPEQIGEPLDFASTDVSFISLKKVIPTAIKLLKSDGEMLCLIKPQFEAGREKVGKKGVVRDPKVHIEVIKGIIDFVIEKKIKIKGIDFSPIKGPEGNIEYLLYMQKDEVNNNCLDNIEQMINCVVENAHTGLNT